MAKKLALLFAGLVAALTLSFAAWAADYPTRPITLIVPHKAGGPSDVIARVLGGMERGGKRPDPPKLAQATVRAAVAEAGRRWPDVPLIAGGKSFGGRMTSQAQAATPLLGVRGLAFFGFPLHPPKQPSQERGRHLFDVQLPMLFFQGTRDALASLDELEPLCQELGKRATLRLFDGADHSFHVPAKSGRTDAQVMSEMLDAFTAWTDKTI